ARAEHLIPAEGAGLVAHPLYCRLGGAIEPGGFASGVGRGGAEQARHERSGLAAETAGSVGLAESRVAAQVARQPRPVLGGGAREAEALLAVVADAGEPETG